MSLDARKRQKKAEKREKRRKDRQAHRLERGPLSLMQKLARGGRGRIVDCLMMGDPRQDGMCSLTLTREIAPGELAVASLLLDLDCLGVKNARVEMMGVSDYEDRWLPRLQQSGPTETWSPATARKLVEDLVAWSRELGFAPHHDYAAAQFVFGDIDASTSTESFEFGHEGKPYFISGPHDTPERCRLVLATLRERLGPGEFHYTLGGRDPEMLDRILEHSGLLNEEVRSAEILLEDDVDEGTR